MTNNPRDWTEFSSALRSESVRFLLIGGHALAFHVEARLTEGLDLFGRDALIKNKRAAGRRKDRMDVALLEERDDQP